MFHIVTCLYLGFNTKLSLKSSLTNYLNNNKYILAECIFSRSTWIMDSKQCFSFIQSFDPHGIVHKDKLINRKKMGTYGFSICDCNRTTCLPSYMTSLNQNLQNATIIDNQNIKLIPNAPLLLCTEISSRIKSEEEKTKASQTLVINKLWMSEDIIYPLETD